MRSQFLHDSDVKLLKWLAQAEEPEKIRVRFISDSLVSVRCGDKFQAAKLHKTRKMVAPLRTELSINGTPYPKKGFSTMTTIATTNPATAPFRSKWAQQNPALFHSFGEIAFIYSANPGYHHLAVQSKLTEKRLNRPIVDLIGQPLRTTDNDIWLPRERAIESAVSQPGELHEFYYEHVFSGVIWRFKGTTLYLADYNEVVCRIEDNPNDLRAAWQRGYWMNLAQP